MKIACVAVVKDEERYIAEWVAYQLALGFDTVVLLDNNSADRTKAIAGGFSPLYDVRVFDWPMRTPDYQRRAYEFAARRFAGEFDWMAFFDADEFLVLDHGAALKHVLASRADAAAVAISWAMFGSSGHRDSPEGLVIENFRHRSPPDFSPTKLVKSIIRPELMKAVLHPHAFDMNGAYVDLAGRPPHWEFTGHLADVPDYSGGKLHHYFTRSWSDWQAKLRRGYRDTKRSEDDFYTYDRNEIYDDKAALLAPLVKAILASIAKRPKYRFSIAACARWETPYIVEWLTYHRALGFSHVFLYCNDDDPAELYQAVLPFTQGSQPFVTVKHHANQGEQLQMYQNFLRDHLCETEWVCFLDVDEFLRLPPAQKIADFMAGFDESVDCVLFNWIFFGPNGHKTPPAGAVLANYTRRSESIHPYTKYVVKASVLTSEAILDPVAGHGFWHSLHDKLPAPIRVVNVLGEDAKDYYDGFPDKSSSRVNQWEAKSRILSTAIIHHYAFRSERAFWDRTARGLKGAFTLQTIWRDLAESDGFATFLADVNATEDLRLAEFWQALIHNVSQNRFAQEAPSALILAGPVPNAALKLGIAITTLNRRDTVLNLVNKIHELTQADYHLVICDDGSTDDSQSVLRAAGQVVIGGTQRGIAWNKNRGIYYLLNIVRCDVIILMDDDIIPVAPGWEAEWIAASWRYGHMNFAHPAFQSSIAGGDGTAGQPYLSSAVPGTAYAFSRIALAQIGYLDVRFGRYGHEHSDFSFRALRAGFGGIKVREDNWNAPYFYVIAGGLEAVPAPTSGTPEELESNARLLGEVANDPIYRHAWLTDETRDVFLGEIEAALGASDAPLRLKSHFLSWRDYRSAQGLPSNEDAVVAVGGKNLALRKSATQSSVSAWSRAPTPEEDAARAVNGCVDGRRKFHTDLEDNPWWQVDLEGFATIREIRIYNTTDETAFRFKMFRLEVSIDGAAWIEIARKEDDSVVGGIVGGPYIWNGPGTAWARFIRITLLNRDFLHLDQVEVYGNLGDETVAAPPVQALDGSRFSRIENPLGGQGFVLGWEDAQLGNRLTSFANLFALTERTGVPTGYAQILSLQNLFEIPDRRFYAHGNLSTGQFSQLDRLTGFVDELFDKGFEAYNDRYMTVSLENLNEMKTESGIIVFSRYRAGFHDLAAVEGAIKSFCGRGNGIILAGAFWHHYLDMRQLRGEGGALRQKLRLNRNDTAGNRAEAMRNAGGETLLVGIHIRQTDYKIWQGGKYYFSAAQYEAVIRQIHDDLAGRPHYFCLCSDAVLDLSRLDGLPLFYERATMLDDFVALSKCHYVVGPPSSFGTWSAFLGGARRVVLTPERMADPGARPPILQNAVEVIYPTGGYLPGDPTAGPV